MLYRPLSIKLEKLPTEPVTLYQYEVCPFCNKVKAYFDYRNVSDEFPPPAPSLRNGQAAHHRRKRTG